MRTGWPYYLIVAVGNILKRWGYKGYGNILKRWGYKGYGNILKCWGYKGYGKVKIQVDKLPN
jgi:hypothetical protein